MIPKLLEIFITNPTLKKRIKEEKRLDSLGLHSDFIGFTFCGYHSFHDLGFYRVSDGSRYNDYLVPNFQDKTAQVPGGDGTYFFETNYTYKPFNVNIAFDSLTESQYRQMRQVFDKNKAGMLIFDEEPYKAYNAKIQSPPQIKYVCFDEGGQRIYKGEGTINFICYYPYAHSTIKFLNEYTPVYYDNLNEWKDASGMKEANNGTYNQVGDSSGTVKLYNPGDLPTDFVVFYGINQFPSSIQLTQDNVTLGILNFSTPGLKSNNDAYIRINSRTHLLEGYDNYFESTGTLYNDIITSGEFFKIPLGDDIYLTSGSGKPCVRIDYNYLYY